MSPMQPELRALLLAPLHDRKTQIVAFFASAAAKALAAVLIIALIHQFLAGVLGGETGLAAALIDRFGVETTLAMVAAMLFVAYLAVGLSAYASEVLRERITRAVEVGTLERLVRHLMGLPMAYFERHGTGDLIQAIRHDTAQLRGYLSSLVRMAVELMLAIGYAGAAVWMSPFLAFWVLLVLPLASTPLLLFAQRTSKESFRVRIRNSALMDTVYQILRGIRVIRVYQSETQELDATVSRARHYLDATLRIVRLQALSTALLETLAGLSIVLIVVVGGIQVLNGTLGWPALLAFLVAVRSLQGPLNNLNQAWLGIRRYSASIHRLLELLSEPSVFDLRGGGTMTLESESIRKLEFRGVGFLRGDQTSLEDIGFLLESGQTLGVVGSSGAGKTTLLNLAARLSEPTSGTILVNDVDAAEIKLASFYQQVALVPQEPFLFDATVSQNISCGKVNSSDGSVSRAATDAGVHTEICKLPDGYKTMLGVGGQGLSLGQAQRLNLARALFKDPSLLLLDEVTSALDSLTESEVKRGIDRRQDSMIRIVVAHRLASVRDADRILVLEEGRCVGFDRHEALLRSCSLYREMWQTQLADQPPLEREAAR